MARCIVTGKGSKGAVIVCETRIGDVVLKAVKTAPHKYTVHAETPRIHLSTTIYAANERELRRRIEEWIEHELP